MSDNRAAVYIEDDITVYRASALGTCSRILWAYRNGLTPSETPDWLQGKFDQGNEAEEKILNWLQRKYNGTCYQKQRLIEVKVGTKILIRGHIDAQFKQNFKGIIETDSEAVVEAKAFARSTYEKFKRCIERGLDGDWEDFIASYPYYAGQFSTYMQALNLPMIVVVGIKDDDGEVEDYDVWVLHDAPIKLSRIKARLLKLEKNADGEMPECDEDIFPCPFFFIHDEKEIVRSTDTDLGELAKQWYEANEAEKKAKEKKKEAAEYIAKTFERLGMDGERITAHDEDDQEWEIKDVISEGREYPNVKKMKEDGIDVEKYIEKGKGNRWPKIRPPKDYTSSESSSSL